MLLRVVSQDSKYVIDSLQWGRRGSVEGRRIERKNESGSGEEVEGGGGGEDLGECHYQRLLQNVSNMEVIKC